MNQSLSNDNSISQFSIIVPSLDILALAFLIYHRVTKIVLLIYISLQDDLNWVTFSDDPHKLRSPIKYFLDKNVVVFVMKKLDN